jgi:hypothetical protein
LNITCPRCRFRHPANVTCDQAARHALIVRNKIAECMADEAARSYRSAVEDYNLAVEAVDARIGVGAADAIVNLMTRWKTLGDINDGR